MYFERLEVWKRAHKLTVMAYKALSQCRDFGFKDQITRSVLSVPSNIAEGMGHISIKERARFYQYARASISEFRAQVLVAKDIGYLTPEDSTFFVEESLAISKMLYALQKSLTSIN
ncbi:four helix bundle protein [Thalassotalea agarivorans]|uniref:Four helix bundle protein n=1 Tax=Thalassotalea agarivorans TaxID=349064 RepID=A0A1H9Y2A7_THASX|nr:four helix bundle protein [Thalassotalea agarivorans]SES62910.1 four helix bundle protein [Thalassotalea agarivorans]